MEKPRSYYQEPCYLATVTLALSRRPKTGPLPKSEERRPSNSPCGLQNLPGNQGAGRWGGGKGTKVASDRKQGLFPKKLVWHPPHLQGNQGKPKESDKGVVNGETDPQERAAPAARQRHHLDGIPVLSNPSQCYRGCEGVEHRPESLRLAVAQARDSAVDLQELPLRRNNVLLLQGNGILFPGVGGIVKILGFVRWGGSSRKHFNKVFGRCRHRMDLSSCSLNPQNTKMSVLSPQFLQMRNLRLRVLR